MVIAPGTLPKLWDLLKRKYFDDSLAAYQWCPICDLGHLPQDPRTMRIFPSLGGDFIFRCHRCASCCYTLELVRRVLKTSTFEEAAAWLLHSRIASYAYSEGELRSYKYLRLVDQIFYRGKQRYSSLVGKNEIEGRCFGDWAAVFYDDFAGICPRELLPRRLSNSPLLIQRLRNIYGHPSSLIFCREDYMPLGRFPLLPKGPAEFAASPWIDNVDLDEIILASSARTAGWLQREVAQWPQERRLAVLHAQCLNVPPLCCRFPAAKVWHVLRDDEHVSSGLALWRPNEAEVRVKWLHGGMDDGIGEHERMERSALCHEGLPTALTFATSRIVHGEVASLGHRLNQILRDPCIAETTKRVLLERCSEVAAKPVLALVDEAGFAASPYAVQRKGQKFVCRGGAYLMQDRKGQWHRISNFSLRIVTSLVDKKGDATHELLLNVEGQVASFTVTAVLLSSAPRLWKAALRCGALAGLPELDMPNAQHRQLLPSLVKVMKGVA